MSRPGTLLLALVALNVCGCGQMSDPWEGETARKRVVVTIPALASFVKAVGGDDVAVRTLCTTTGPHEAKPDSRDAVQLRRADLLFSVGLSLDENLADTLYLIARNPNLGHVKLGHKVSKSKLLELAHDHDHAHGDGHHHHHGHYDPHVWLGIPEAIEMVNAIAAALSERDEEHKETYEKNAAAYVSQLKALQVDGLKELEGKKTKRVISFHESMGYFARAFGLSVAAVMEAAPGDEPSPGHLAKLAKLVKDPAAPIGAITVEPQYAEGSAKKLSEAAGGKVPLVEVDPLETADPKQLKEEGKRWYLKRMEQNIKKLAAALP